MIVQWPRKRRAEQAGRQEPKGQWPVRKPGRLRKPEPSLSVGSRTILSPVPKPWSALPGPQSLPCKAGAGQHCGDSSTSTPCATPGIDLATSTCPLWPSGPQVRPLLSGWTLCTRVGPSLQDTSSMFCSFFLFFLLFFFFSGYHYVTLAGLAWNVLCREG